MRKYTHAPHPFVFEPNEENHTRVRSGQAVLHGLVLVGEAIRYLPYFFLAIQELGRNGLGGDLVPFQVNRVVTETGISVFEQPRHSHFEQAGVLGLSLEPGQPRTTQFELRFETPARIVVNGQISRHPSLVDIVKALSRRLFLLRHFHCGRREQPVSEAFIEAASAAHCLHEEIRWLDAARYSTRQRRRVPIGGIVGRMSYEGDLGILEPLLRAGEYVHVGKNTTFGLGKYVLREGVGP